ncbi:MAG: 9-O-acetylesterase, partial [Muribaculaceae bacterium]|nr:9-O-acetylesterase [Muribaculaceae bacterium]
MTTRTILMSAAMLMAAYAGAEVRLPSLLSDNMVLQQCSDARLWGTAAPGARVRVTASWSEDRVETREGKAGAWELRVA